MLQVNGGGGAIVFADGLDGAGDLVAAQVFLDELLGGNAVGLALTRQVMAKEILGVGMDQALGQGRWLDQKEPPEIAGRKLLVGLRVHGGCGSDVENGK